MAKDSKNALADANDDVYDAEKIVKLKYVRGVPYGQVKWKGYSNAHNTW